MEKYPSFTDEVYAVDIMDDLTKECCEENFTNDPLDKCLLNAVGDLQEVAKDENNQEPLWKVVAFEELGQSKQESPKELEVGQTVFLFNSNHEDDPGEWNSKKYESFVITHISPCEAIEIVRNANTSSKSVIQGVKPLNAGKDHLKRDDLFLGALPFD